MAIPSFIGWNGTREAARAVNDAIPLLQRAHSVTVLTVNHHEEMARSEDILVSDVAFHLARHGIATTVAHTTADDISVGDALLNYASDMGADLLVVGGYGHSRMREIMLGGVTQLLLRSMTLPVLISH